MKHRKLRKDYPNGVIGIYDNGGRSFDHYTVVYEPIVDSWGCKSFFYRGMSDNPFHPQGFGQMGECRWRLTSVECGKVINFGDLPAQCQRLVLMDTDNT